MSVTSEMRVGSPATTVPALISRGRDELAHEPHRDVGDAALHFRFKNVSLVDADEVLFDLFTACFRVR